MARVLVRLKIALLRNSMRDERRRRAFVLAAAVALGAGVAGFIVLAVSPWLLATTGFADVGIHVVAAVVAVGWLAGPVIGFGLDETLDPMRLELYPGGLVPRIVGLLGASCVGLGGAATLMALSGSFVGSVSSPAALPFVAVAVVGLVLFGVTAARALTTALSSLLRSRRGGDLVLVGLTLAVIALAFGAIAVAPVLRRLADEGRLGVLARWWELSPPGAFAAAIAAARTGRFVESAWHAVTGWSWVVGAVVVWAVAFAQIRAGRGGGSGRRRGRASSLVPAVAAWLPRDRVGAVAAKNIRAYGRDPRQRAQLLATVVFFVMAASLALALTWDVLVPQVTLAAASTVWFTGLQGMNRFGWDGPAVWLNVVAAGDWADDLRGSSIAVAYVAVPVLVVATVALAAITGGWVYAAPALAAGFCGLLIADGCGMVASVVLAWPQAESTTGNVYANRRPGDGCATAIAGMAVFGVYSALFVPVLAVLVIGAWGVPLLLWASVVVLPVYGLAVWRVGRRIACDQVRYREPELLARLQR